jgi:predicted nicotinamide N-methyase
MNDEATQLEHRSATADSRSEYRGPVTISTLHFGHLTIRVVRPADPEQLLDDPAVLDWNRRDDYMPYWPHLWPGAHLLADALAAEPWPQPQHEPMSPEGEVLEIGCGLGLAGLVALALGREVRFTDYDPGCFGFIARSATENGIDASRLRCEVLDWRKLPDEQFPLILGADVIYEHRLVPMVAHLLERMLAPGGTALLASPYRVAAETFPAAVESLGLACHCEPRSVETEDGRHIDGTVYRVTHRV